MSNNLTAISNSGLLDIQLQNHSIGFNGYTTNDLLSAKQVTFFTNWTDLTNFPKIYGSGVIIPSVDSRNNFILYITTNGTYSGIYKSGDGITWNKLN